MLVVVMLAQILVIHWLWISQQQLNLLISSTVQHYMALLHQERLQTM